MGNATVPITQIVSGGQTGADRAALDVGLELGLCVGGWVPAERWAEDGAIPAHYPNLRQTETADPAERTRRNVCDSDATLVLSHGIPTAGSAFTLACAQHLGKPVLHLDLSAMPAATAARRLREWIAARRPVSLNVAGPRASQDPEIYTATRDVLRAALSHRMARD